MFGKGAPRCRRCKEAVYAAEEIIGAGQKWHTQCFACLDCKTRLSSTLLTENEGEIYCSTCYAKRFGPKGYGIGSQSLTYTGVSVTDAAGSKANNSYAGSASAGGAKCCGKTVEGKFCGQCGKATGGASSPAPAAAAAATSTPAAAAAAPKAAASPQAQWTASGISRPAAFQMNTGGDATKCGLCAKTVYDAEKVMGGGKIWHSSCYRCTDCKSGLNSTNTNDKDGKLYCGPCYAKSFGPNGYGFAGGGASMFAFTR